MTLKRLFVSLGRRWYLTVAGVLVTLGLCAGAYLNTEPTLERSASDLLVPGKTTIPEGGNPYLYLGGLGQLSDVLVSSLNSEQTIGSFQDRFPGTTISVARDTSTSGPMITVTVSGTRDEAVAGALKAVVDEVPKALGQLQATAAVPADARISVITLTSDGKSTVINKSRFETIGMVGVAGLVVTILLVGLIDGLLLGRRQRAAEKAAGERAAAETAAGGSDGPDATPTGPVAAETDADADAEPRRASKSPKPAKRPGRKRPAPARASSADAGAAAAPSAAPAPSEARAPSAAPDASAAPGASTPPVTADPDEQDIDWEYLLTQSAPRTGRESSER